MGKVVIAILIFLHILPITLLAFIYTNGDVSRFFENSDCYPKFQKLNLGFCIFFLTLFSVGLMFVLSRIRLLQITYVAVLLIVPFMFSLVIGPLFIGGHDYVDPEKNIKCAYLLDSYPVWAQKFMITPNDWNAFTSCMSEKQICQKLKKWDIFQRGCCNPPVYCGFRDHNKTWVVPESGLYAKDRECVVWSNDSSRRCFGCETCKAAYINRFAYIWTMRGFYMVFACLPLLICFGFTPDNNDKRNGTRSDGV